MIRRPGLAVVLAAVGALASGCMAFSTAESPFHAGARNQGSWLEGGRANGPGNDNYFVGWVLEDFPETEYKARNYFTFDLTDACEAGGVILKVTRFTQTAPIAYKLFDVTTPADVLNAETAQDPAVFEDLGSGTSFGTFNVTPGDRAEVVSFPLNRAGVAAYNDARGGFFSIGGAAPDASLGEYLFGHSGESQGAQHLLAVCKDQPA